ncbi:MAG: response regulator transcription factor [Ignavibacteriae bacterium]|nr:response regulator transcription factor [Ignavibacteriota bacterium]
MTIKCIAVDDEPLALDIIKDYVSRIPFLKLIKTFSEGISVIEYLSSNTVDLIFLDIEMGGISGTQLLKSLQKKPKVIMTTAYRNYAVDAFDLNVTDYLLKPFSFDRFLQAVEKAHTLIKSEQPHLTSESTERKYFFVKSDGKLIKVNFDDILYIEGMSEYLVIKTRNGNIITLQNFRNIEESLPDSGFVRIHKSYLVSLNKIESVKGQCVIISGKELPIGNKFKKEFFSIISSTDKRD